MTRTDVRHAIRRWWVDFWWRLVPTQRHQNPYKRRWVCMHRLRRLMVR